MQIQDGTGKAYWVHVDTYNRLAVHSTNMSEISEISARNNRAYSTTTDAMTFNSTNEHPLLYMRNDNTDLKLFFDSIDYSYNRGDTNHNRSMIKRVYINPPVPTGNYTECTVHNMNFSSFLDADMLCYKWDQSDSDGMTVDLSNTESFSTSLVTTNLTLENISGIILGYRNSVLFTFEPEEVGKASISTKFYFNWENC